MDPREGLTRRYTLEGVLQALGGKPKIEPLNYDGLRMIRDPLYVKMGQELREESKAQTGRIVADQDFLNTLRGLASQQGVPMDQLEDILRRVMAVSGPPAPPPSDTEMEEEQEEEDKKSEGAATTQFDGGHDDREGGDPPPPRCPPSAPQ